MRRNRSMTRSPKPAQEVPGTQPQGGTRRRKQNSERRRLNDVSRGDGTIGARTAGERQRGVSRADGIIRARSVGGWEQKNGAAGRFIVVSRGDGIIRTGAVGGREQKGGATGRFIAVSRADGIIAGSRMGARQRGFSLIEIILVVVLIGGIVAFAATRILGGGDRARVNLAKAQVQTLAEKVQQFEMDTGTLPNTLDELVTQPGNAGGWLGPYAKSGELKDPWNMPFEYRVPGDGQAFNIVSFGADKRAGGNSVDADISYE